MCNPFCLKPLTMKPESRYQAVTAEKNQSLGQLPLFAVPLGVGPTVVPDYYLGPPLFVC
jgi:hypothetical protein